MNPVLLHAWREGRIRPARRALALAGVVLGVAAFVAILISTRGARQAYQRVYASLAGAADLEVVADGARGVDPALAERLRAVPGVRAALPVVQGSAALVAPGPRTPVFLLGVLPEADGALRPLDLEQGGPLTTADGALVPAAFARERGLTVGGTLRLVTAVGPVDLPVVGLMRPTMLPAMGGVTLLLPIATAQRLLALAGRASAIQVDLDDDTQADALALRLAPLLPQGLSTARPWARGLLAEGTLGAADAGLAAVSLMALVAAVFVIGNAFAMGLVERRRALALLRSLGATRGQVARGLLAEALVLGLVGSLGGLALGVPAARGVAAGLEQMLGTRLPEFPVGWQPVVLALLMGPLSTLAGAFAPIRRAQRRDVLHDLQGLPDTSHDERARQGPWLGLVLLAFALGVGVGLAAGWVPSALVAPGVAAAMLGAALAFPWLVPWLRRRLAGAAEAWPGAAGWIGLQQVARRPVNATLTATMLFVSVMGGVGMGGRILAAVADVRSWSAQALYEDYYVRATMPESGTMLAAPVPPGLADELAVLPEVERVSRIRFLPARSGAQALLVIARTFEPGRAPRLAFREPRDGLRAPPAPDEVVLGVTLAQRLGLGVGDRLELAAAGGPLSLRVAATATEYTAGGYAAYLSWEGAVAALGDGAPHALMVTARPGAREALGRALATLCQRQGLMLQTNAELREAVDGMVGGIMGLLWASLLLVFAVASVGVANTLTAAVADQTRSLGMLRAVGMTRAQVRRSVLAQAVGMALLGALPGALAGQGLGWLLQELVARVHGYPLSYELDVGLLLGCVSAAVAVAALAAYLPARRAALLAVPEALRYE